MRFLRGRWDFKLVWGLVGILLPLSVFTPSAGADAGMVAPGSVASRYLNLTGLYLQLRSIEGEDFTLDTLETLEGRIRNSEKTLRKSLFGKEERILELFQFRADLFGKLLQEKEREYLTLKESAEEKDKVLRDRIFKELQNIEAKVIRIHDAHARLSDANFRKKIKREFRDLMRDYKRFSRFNQAKQLAIKEEILNLLEQIAIRYGYPLETVAQIQRKKQDLQQLSGVYTRWQDLDEGGEMVSRDDPEDNNQLPVRRDDDFEMVGRKNYMTTVVTREKDHRLHDRVVKTPTLYDRAPMYTEGREVRKKYLESRYEKEDQE